MEHLRAASRGAGQQAFLSISHEPLAAFSGHVTGHVLLGPSIQPGVKASVQACVHELVGLKEITGTRHKGTSQTVYMNCKGCPIDKTDCGCSVSDIGGIEKKQERQKKKRKKKGEMLKLPNVLGRLAQVKSGGNSYVSKDSKNYYFHIILIHQQLDTNQVNVILYEKNVEYIIV